MLFWLRFLYLILVFDFQMSNLYLVIFSISFTLASILSFRSARINPFPYVFSFSYSSPSYTDIYSLFSYLKQHFRRAVFRYYDALYKLECSYQHSKLSLFRLFTLLITISLICVLRARASILSFFATND